MTVKIYHDRETVEEPAWTAVKLRKGRLSRYHLALRSKRKKHMHITYSIGKRPQVSVLIDHAHAPVPEEFRGRISAENGRRYLIVEHLPRFVAHRILIDVDSVDGAALEAEDEAEFQRIVEGLRRRWRVKRKGLLRVLLCHVGDILRLALESRHVLRELKSSLRGAKGFKKNGAL